MRCLEGAFRIGECLVRPELNNIVIDPDDLTDTRDEEKSVQINPKSMAVLVLMARNAGEVLTKEALLEKIWEDRFVTEEVLTTAIWELRKAFGDDARKPSVIQTVHRKGYRLIAPVSELDFPVASSSNESGADESTEICLLPSEAFLSKSTSAPRPVTVAKAPRAPAIPKKLIIAGLFGIGFLISSLAYDSLPALRARYHFWQGKTFHQMGDYSRAVPHLEKTVALDDELLEAFDLLANIDHIYGYKERALARVDQALNSPTIREDSTGSLLLKRRKAQIEGDILVEEQRLRDLLKRFPDDTEWLFKHGWFNKTHWRDCTESKDFYDDALRWAKGDRELLAYRADTLLSCESPQIAIEYLLEEWAFEKNARYHDQLAHAYLMAGRYEEAEDHVDRARQLDKLSSIELEGDVAFAQGRYERARRSYERYRDEAEHPTQRAAAFRSLARVELAMGSIAAAEKHVDDALEARPDFVSALWIKGLIRVEQSLRAGQHGDEALADSYLSRSQQLADRIHQVCCARGSRHEKELYHHLEGSIYLARKDFENAVPSFQRAIDLHPEDRAFFLAAKAEAFLLSGERQRAFEAFEKVFEYNAQHPRSRCLYGKLFDEEGKLSRAKDEYEKCLTVFGDQPQDPVGQAAQKRLFDLGTTLDP